MDLIEESKIRCGTSADASLRNGAMTTLIAPEAVLRRSLAGAFAEEAGWGITVMLMEPDIVWMERRSWRRKVPVTLWDMWLMVVERDMMNGWVGDFWGCNRCCFVTFGEAITL